MNFWKKKSPKKLENNDMVGWLFGCRVEANCPLVRLEPVWGVLSVGDLSKGPKPMDGMPSVEVFLKDPSPYLREFWRKPWGNSKRLGRQAQPGIEPGTSCLSALSAESLRHWWGHHDVEKDVCYFKNFENKPSTMYFWKKNNFKIIYYSYFYNTKYF